MSGIYGSMLSYFPELFRIYEIHPIYKSPNGGMSVDTDPEHTFETINGILLDGAGKGGWSIRSFNFKKYDNRLVFYGEKEFWSYRNLDDYLPKDTDYDKPCAYAIKDTHTSAGKVYYCQIMSKVSWGMEGDFYRYIISIIGGNDAINKQDASASDFASFLS